MRLSLIIEKDIDGYFAYCAELPGCHTDGISLSETISIIHEALNLHLDTLDEDEHQPFGILNKSRQKP